MATHGKARERYITAIRNREAFKGSAAISAVTWQSWDTGHLPAEWRERYRAATVTYTVLSYRTPIAWVEADGTVVIPDVRYSRTTTHHQSLAHYLNR